MKSMNKYESTGDGKSHDEREKEKKSAESSQVCQVSMQRILSSKTFNPSLFSTAD
jgi:hypothetical protein